MKIKKKGTNISGGSIYFFTVIMPCYNGEKFIEEAINSVLTQTYPEFELIIVNDGSTDESLKLMKRFAQQDRRIRIISLKENKGLASARNIALDNAKGRYVAFLDCDDLWPEKKLSIYVDFIKQGYDLIYSNYIIFSQSQKNRTKQIKVPLNINYPMLRFSNFIPLSSAVFNFEKAPNIRFKKSSLSEDWIFWIDIIKYMDKSIGLQSNLMLYRKHQKNMSNSKVKMLLKAWNIIRHDQKLSFIHSCYGICYFLATKIKKHYL